MEQVSRFVGSLFVRRFGIAYVRRPYQFLDYICNMDDFPAFGRTAHRHKNQN